VEVDDYDPIGKAEYTVIVDGKELTAFTWADALTPKGADTIAIWKHSQFSGESAVTRNRRGKGLAWYFGTFGDDAFYCALLPKALADARISHGIHYPSGVDFSWRVKDDERYLFLMNHNAEDLTVSLPKSMASVLGPNPVDNRVTLRGYDVGVYRG
jgi:beta-galactosidase